MPNPVTAPISALAREAAETPAVARRQIERSQAAFAALGERLRKDPPKYVVTCARGSSDHATTYGKYLIETHAGRVVASVGPSIASVYESPLDLTGSLFIAVSQSGRSPDILRLTEAAKKSGALTVGFINDETSPLFSMCDAAIPLSAGAETSVAATKSYLLSALAYLQLVAHWRQDKALLDAVAELPDALSRAVAIDWRPVIETLSKVVSMYVVARGVGLGVGMEMALKLKEVCGLHAEAFSSAEVIHGPLALAGPGFPVMLVGQRDETLAGILDAGKRFVDAGSRVISTVDIPGATVLPTVESKAVIAPLCQLLSFYMAVSELARSRGLDPDKPPHLRKVTETV